MLMRYHGHGNELPSYRADTLILMHEDLVASGTRKTSAEARVSTSFLLQLLLTKTAWVCDCGP